MDLLPPGEEGTSTVEDEGASGRLEQKRLQLGQAGVPVHTDRRWGRYLDPRRVAITCTPNEGIRRVDVSGKEIRTISRPIALDKEEWNVNIENRRE